jgi:hypothetical protein
VQEILIDGGQFVLQRLVEEVQNFRVALHGSPLDGEFRAGAGKTCVRSREHGGFIARVEGGG